MCKFDPVFVIVTPVINTTAELFLVTFVFTNEYIAPISMGKSISLFPTVNYIYPGFLQGKSSR